MNSTISQYRHIGSSHFPAATIAAVAAFVTVVVLSRRGSSRNCGRSFAEAGVGPRRSYYYSSCYDDNNGSSSSYDDDDDYDFDQQKIWQQL